VLTYVGVSMFAIFSRVRPHGIVGVLESVVVIGEPRRRMPTRCLNAPGKAEPIEQVPTSPTRTEFHAKVTSKDADQLKARWSKVIS